MKKLFLWTFVVTLLCTWAVAGADQTPPVSIMAPAGDRDAIKAEKDKAPQEVLCGNALLSNVAPAGLAVPAEAERENVILLVNDKTGIASPAGTTPGGDVTLVEVCPPNSMYSAPPHTPNDAWSAGTSDIAFQPEDYLRYDNFTGATGDICDIHWWGLSLYFGPPWYVCEEDPYEFEIIFYPDLAGKPDTLNPVYTYSPVVPVRTLTGDLYAGYPLYRYDMILDPCIQLVSGWVSIRGISIDPDYDCAFLWMSSPIGDGHSWFRNGGILEDYFYDNSMCITGEYVETYGACCDDATGICVDDIEMQQCPPPLRFAANTLCAALDPPCGELPGACCDPATGDCLVLTEDECADAFGGTGVYMGDGTVCDPNPCECIVECEPDDTDEGEPDCYTDYEDVTNGGCNAAPPVFGFIDNGETICGNSGVYDYDGGQDNYRDTDWFEIYADAGPLTWTVTANFDALIFLIQAGAPGNECPGLVIISSATGAPCDVLTLSTDVTECGTYYLWVGPVDWTPLDCASATWRGTATYTPCAAPIGRCCEEDLTCHDITREACQALPNWDSWNGGADCTDGCPVCVDFTVNAPVENATGTTCGAGNDCDLRPSEEIVYEVEIPSDGEWTFSLCGSDFDTYMFVGTTCCGQEVGYNDDFCGPQSQLTATIAAGTYYVDIECYYADQCGNYVLNVFGAQEVVPYDGCETFDTYLHSFVPYVLGDDNDGWVHDLGDGNPAGSAYHGYTMSGVVCNDWLVSYGDYTVPAAPVMLFFDEATAWCDDYILHEVLISTDYVDDNDPTQYTWTQLYEGCGPGTWTTQTVDISAYEGQDVHFALHYAGEFASEWSVDNVCVAGTPMGACCVDLECVATETEEECIARPGIWYEGEDCFGDPPFICPYDCADAVWHNGDPNFASIYASQCAPDQPFQGQAADDVIFEVNTNVEAVVSWLDGWNNYGDPFESPADFEGIQFVVYPDVGGVPGGNPLDDVDCSNTGDIVYEEIILPGDFSYMADGSGWKVWFDLGSTVTLQANTTYWVVVEPIFSFTAFGQGGPITTEVLGSLPLLFFPAAGIYDWQTPATWTYGLAFCLLGEAVGPPLCDYVPGDCNHNGVALELADVIAMIGMYRGTVTPAYTCDCPPHGATFAPTADPNGNCVALELGDVVTEIAAYRGTGTAYGCADCPGDGPPPPLLGKEGTSVVPSLKSKVKTTQQGSAD